MSDLLKEAIADAKAVRETALQNAKMALEEAFTPHLKSMLSAKLAEDDMEDEDEDDAVVDIDIDADDEEEVEAEEGANQYREEDDEEIEIGDEEEVDESEIIEIDGVKYAPIVSEEEEEYEDEDEEVDESEELDLEAVIKELESELAEESDPGEEEESVNEVDEDDSETVEEEVVTEEETTEEETVDEEVVNEEEDDSEVVVEEDTTNEEVETLQGELKEYKEAVSFLRDKLHEVNILNAKLLYTNKLFKEYVLSNDQKLKIVETFDRAQTTREIKLVYSTLAESYKDNGGERKEVVKESYASKKSGGTAPKTKIITEESQVANRFRKLAGLKS